MDHYLENSFPDYSIVRKPQMVEKVLFVDGQPGCGKSMFSSIVASLDRVEKMTIKYQIEMTCALRLLNRIDEDVAIALIGLYTDLTIYDQMMSREINFRPRDVSSVFRDPKPLRYIKRLFQKGNEIIPERIKREQPILHFTTHDLLSRSEPVFNALGDRVIFIEVVRHPLYMVKQEALNMEWLINDPRHFEIYYTYQGNRFPYFTLGWEDIFLKSNNIERAVYMIDNMHQRAEEFKKRCIGNILREEQILTIPFEQFVIHPWLYMNKIEEALGTKKTPATFRIMKREKVPRKMYAAGRNLAIYKRYGWETPKKGTDERKELALRRDFVKKHSSSEVLKIVDMISAEYEERYLGEKLNYQG